MVCWSVDRCSSRIAVRAVTESVSVVNGTSRKLDGVAPARRQRDTRLRLTGAKPSSSARSS